MRNSRLKVKEKEATANFSQLLKINDKKQDKRALKVESEKNGGKR